MGKKVQGVIIVIILMLSLICLWMALRQVPKQAQPIEDAKEGAKVYAQDHTFYLQEGKLYVIRDNKSIEVPGDFSQMKMSHYKEGTYQSKENMGNIYFYYQVDSKLYLVRTSDYQNWTTQELTGQNIGVPAQAKIKQIRISGNYGYIFYIDKDGVGDIIRSTTQGNYWSKVETSFSLDDNCELKFLDTYGMTVDGFLTVPQADGSKCDLYQVNNEQDNPFELVDISGINPTDHNLSYYHMPYYEDNQSNHLIYLEVGENKEDKNPVTFVNYGTWITKEAYDAQKDQEKQKEQEADQEYDQAAEQLDEKIFVKNFDAYQVTDNSVQISKSQAKKIAEKGFQESAKRIAAEGIVDTEEETDKVEEVTPNNYFTRKHNGSDQTYPDKKRKAYVFMKTNEMGNGVAVFVDVTTGKIIGGEAYGD